MNQLPDIVKDSIIKNEKSGESYHHEDPLKLMKKRKISENQENQW